MIACGQPAGTCTLHSWALTAAFNPVCKAVSPPLGATWLPHVHLHLALLTVWRCSCECRPCFVAINCALACSCKASQLALCSASCVGVRAAAVCVLCQVLHFGTENSGALLPQPNLGQ